MKLKEYKVSSKSVYCGKILSVFVDDVRLPDGSLSKREYVRHCGGAAVLFVKDGCAALVKQYRYVYDKEIYEIPAGKIDGGETSVKAAERELEEETGYRALSLEKLARIYPSTGYTDEVIDIYFTDNAEYVGQKCDEGEFLDCEFIRLSRVAEMIESGEICDAKTVCAVYKYLSANK